MTLLLTLSSVPSLYIPITILVALLNNIAAYYMLKLLNIIVLCKNGLVVLFLSPVLENF